MGDASLSDPVVQAPPIEVFDLITEYNKDEHPDKVNLCVEAYRTPEGKPWVLPVVRTVETQMAADQTLAHEYLPVAGLPNFREAACKLILGADDPKVGGVQTLGGTGAIWLAADFTKQQLGFDTVYVSNPTWGIHKVVCKAVGITNIKEYRYWNAETKGIDIDGMLEDLGGAPPKSVVIFHAVAHNPTGVDPTKDQWRLIADVCKEKGLFVLMDCAYQGLATRDVEKDAFSCRLFYERNFEFFIAQSFSTNFGLYDERVGNLCVIAKDSDAKTRVMSQLEVIVRGTYSNPANHGARIVDTILNNGALFAEWKEHIKTMSTRIVNMRQQLHEMLKAIGCAGNWDHIVIQRGMFSYSGLNVQQCEQLKKKYHIFIMKSGRINMCGLTPNNIDYVAKAINEVVETVRPGQQSKI